MKIVCVIGSIGVGGGAERVMSHLCNYFAENHSVVYLALSKCTGKQYFLKEQVKLYNGINYKNKLSAVFTLRRILLSEKPDVIISFLTQVNISVLLATRFTNIPVVVSDRGDLSVKNKLRKYLRLYLYPKAAGIVFQTKDARNFFKGRIHEKSIVIPNPVFVSENLLHSTILERKKEIVSVGRLDYQKNHEMTIHAFARLHSKYPQYVLSIYGYGALREKLQQLISSLGLEKSVILCGNRPDLHERIKDTQLFVMSSRWEGMPNALMEAMALGLPCISTDCPVGAPRELIQDGINGILIPKEDQKALEEKMDYLLSNIEDANRMGEKAKDIQNEYSVEKISKIWESYILSIVKGNKHD